MDLKDESGSDRQDDSEEEVFFGAMTEKELQRAARYQRRRTEYYYPDFRVNRQSLLDFRHRYDNGRPSMKMEGECQMVLEDDRETKSEESMGNSDDHQHLLANSDSLAESCLESEIEADSFSSNTLSSADEGLSACDEESSNRIEGADDSLIVHQRRSMLGNDESDVKSSSDSIEDIIRVRESSVYGTAEKDSDDGSLSSYMTAHSGEKVPAATSSHLLVDEIVHQRHSMLDKDGADTKSSSDSIADFGQVRESSVYGTAERDSDAGSLSSYKTAHSGKDVQPDVSNHLEADEMSSTLPVLSLSEVVCCLNSDVYTLEMNKCEEADTFAAPEESCAPSITSIEEAQLAEVLMLGERACRRDLSCSLAYDIECDQNMTRDSLDSSTTSDFSIVPMPDVAAETMMTIRRERILKLKEAEEQHSQGFSQFINQVGSDSTDHSAMHQIVNASDAGGKTITNEVILNNTTECPEPFHLADCSNPTAALVDKKCTAAYDGTEDLLVLVDNLPLSEQQSLHPTESSPAIDTDDEPSLELGIDTLDNRQIVDSHLLTSAMVGATSGESGDADIEPECSLRLSSSCISTSGGNSSSLSFPREPSSNPHLHYTDTTSVYESCDAGEVSSIYSAHHRQSSLNLAVDKLCVVDGSITADDDSSILLCSFAKNSSFNPYVSCTSNVFAAEENIICSSSEMSSRSAAAVGLANLAEPTRKSTPAVSSLKRKARSSTPRKPASDEAAKHAISYTQPTTPRKCCTLVDKTRGADTDSKKSLTPRKPIEAAAVIEDLPDILQSPIRRIHSLTTENPSPVSSVLKKQVGRHQSESVLLPENITQSFTPRKSSLKMPISDEQAEGPAEPTTPQPTHRQMIADSSFLETCLNNRTKIIPSSPMDLSLGQEYASEYPHTSCLSTPATARSSYATAFGGTSLSSQNLTPRKSSTATSPSDAQAESLSLQAIENFTSTMTHCRSSVSDDSTLENNVACPIKITPSSPISDAPHSELINASNAQVSYLSKPDTAQSSYLTAFGEISTYQTPLSQSLEDDISDDDASTGSRDMSCQTSFMVVQGIEVGSSNRATPNANVEKGGTSKNGNKIPVPYGCSSSGRKANPLIPSPRATFKIPTGRVMKSPGAAGGKSTKQLSTQSPLSGMQSPKSRRFNHIVSPIGQYINEIPAPPLITNVKPAGQKNESSSKSKLPVIRSKPTKGQLQATRTLPGVLCPSTTPNFIRPARRAAVGARQNFKGFKENVEGDAHVFIAPQPCSVVGRKAGPAWRDTLSNSGLLLEQSILENLGMTKEELDQMGNGKLKREVISHVRKELTRKEKAAIEHAKHADRESHIPVLPYAIYEEPAALAAMQKELEIVTKLHTVKNSKLPVPSPRPLVLKHTGNRKKLQWANSLVASSPDAFSSPSCPKKSEVPTILVKPLDNEAQNGANYGRPMEGEVDVSIVEVHCCAPTYTGIKTKKM